MRFLIMLLFPVLLTAGYLEARIKFDAPGSVQIDLEKLEIKKTDFFNFVTRVVHQNPFGLQAYDQVPFHVCHLERDGRRLIDYQTLEGREIRLISNPSCAQVVLLRLLETNYQYQAENLGFYQNRKCIRSLERIFSPLLEYYTIQYEEKKRPNCVRCDEKERERLNKITDIQRKTEENCRAEQPKIATFLNNLDETIEKAFQSKKYPSQP